MTAMASREKPGDHAMWCWLVLLIMLALVVSGGCCWVVRHKEGVFRAWASLETFMEEESCRRFLRSFGFSGNDFLADGR